LETQVILDRSARQAWFVKSAGEQQEEVVLFPDFWWFQAGLIFLVYGKSGRD